MSDFDPAKEAKNLQKHRVSLARWVDLVDFTVVPDDRFDYGEVRIITFGMLNGRVVAITLTESDEVTRIISIRKALKNEEEIYYKEIRN